MENKNTQAENLKLIRESLEWDEIAQRAEILRQRAEQYASPIKDLHEPSAEMLSILTFRLGDEFYGVDVMRVKTVRVLPKLTYVPGVPHFYRGVVNLRGQVITVLDISRFFDIPGIDIEDAREMIVVQGDQLELGLLAHHVSDVLTLSRASLQPFDTFRYTLGVTRNRLVVLSVAQLLQDERLIVGGVDE